ncbi:hypothetical protein GCM10022267_89310 [Lentzea roselyniae]|uniref:Uncharacterized protein n=1 Tax=Lentzea roselyniae TaxID=531940 RepID=A0ABP7CG29_9PSEU
MRLGAVPAFAVLVAILAEHGSAGVALAYLVATPLAVLLGVWATRAVVQRQEAS